MFGRISTTKSTGSCLDKIEKLKKALSEAEAVYACINYGEAVCPDEIKEQSICIDGDIGTVIEDLM